MTRAYAPEEVVDAVVIGTGAGGVSGVATVRLAGGLSGRMFVITLSVS